MKNEQHGNQLGKIGISARIAQVRGKLQDGIQAAWWVGL